MPDTLNKQAAIRAFARRAVRIGLPRLNRPAGATALAGVRTDQGTAAIEFAIIAPVFLLMLMGIVVYGVYFATWIAITEAASEGARASVAGLSTSERVSLATARVTNFFSYYAPMLNLSHATILAQQAPGTNNGAFQVEITYDFTSFGFAGLSGIVPVPTPTPSVTITVSNGG